MYKALAYEAAKPSLLCTLILYAFPKAHAVEPCSRPLLNRRRSRVRRSKCTQSHRMAFRQTCSSQAFLSKEAGIAADPPLEAMLIVISLFVLCLFHGTVTYVLPTDTTRLQEAIQHGTVKSLNVLLREMTEPQQNAQLCAKYGGSEDFPGSPNSYDLHVRTSPMLHAARCGNSEAFSSPLRLTRALLKPQLKEILKATDGIGRTVLAMAASSGRRDAFDTVLAAVKDELDPTEVIAMMKAKDSGKRSLLTFAAESMDEDTFKAVQEYLERELTEEEIYYLIAPGEFLGNRLLLEAVKSKEGKDLGLLKTVLTNVVEYFHPGSPDVERLQRNRELHEQTLLCEAVRCCEIDLFQTTPGFVEKHRVTDRKVAKEIRAIVSKWANDSKSEQTSLKGNEHTEGTIGKFFENLLRANKLLDWVKKCFSGPLVSSKNPFIPGLTLSVALSRSAENASEGERRNLFSLQQTVDDFLLEVLERLPQTVRGCKGRMNCSLLFEPKHLDQAPSPLQMMLSKREQRLTFCGVPLVMDYISPRFSRGLPDLLDTDGILADRELLGNLAKTNGGLVLDDIALEEPPTAFPGNCQMLLHLRNPLMLLHGADPDFPGLAGIPIIGRCPGLQFITAGIVGRPSQYYRVPVLRMALDFVMYAAMLAVFSASVIVQSNGELTWGEIVFFVSFVAAGALRELREMASDLEAYFGDHWNVLDVLSLAMLLGGFIVRSIDSASPWGQAFYALSAPLMFSRVLFFAQILQFQVPMIQVIFSMTAELIKFGVVMLVVMLGFVMTFFALFQDDGMFGQMWLGLFRAMLGDDELFDDFGEQIRDHVAKVLLIVYLVIMSIMFLNLLIAVLSTAYSKVEENVDREFNVSKARVIQHYEIAVENELLPAPFSLLQLSLSRLSVVTSSVGRNAEQFFGLVVFWLVVGPAAVAVGVLLWIISVFHAPYAWTRHYYSREPASTESLRPGNGFMAMQWVNIIVWCGLLAPLSLVVMWLGAPLRSGWKWLIGGCCRGQENPYDVVGSTGFSPDVRAPDSFNVNEILLNEADGVDARDLFAYLEDPMSDPQVREGEINRPTTVEHIKLLRNRLEDAAKNQVDGLRVVREEIKQIEQRLEQKLKKVMCILGKVGQISLD